MSALPCGCDLECQTGAYYCSRHAEDSARAGLPDYANRLNEQNAQAQMRQFKTGATRHTDEGKLDYDGFLSPVALEAFAHYMHTHRIQADGQVRASDNWQKGIPIEAYRKSLLRHVIDYWALSRGHITEQVQREGSSEADLLCAIWFNVQGILHELRSRWEPLGRRAEDV